MTTAEPLPRAHERLRIAAAVAAAVGVLATAWVFVIAGALVALAVLVLGVPAFVLAVMAAVDLVRAVKVRREAS